MDDDSSPANLADLIRVMSIQSEQQTKVLEAVHRLAEKGPSSSGQDDADPVRDGSRAPRNAREAWEDYLPLNKRQPESQAAVDLVERMRFPPPLSMVNEYTKDLVRYEGIEETPPPRQNYVDKKEAALENKLEVALNLLVKAADRMEDESNAYPALARAAALVRSAREDVRQSRRSAIARGVQLDKRPDDSNPRLLTEAEEAKVRAAQKDRARKSNAQGSGVKGGRRRSNSNPRQKPPRKFSQQNPRPHQKGGGKGKEKDD